FERAIHRIQKIVAVRLHVEPNQVRAEQPVDQLALPRTNRERLRIRPRDVPENRDPSVRTRFLDHPWRESEVIILHEDHRIRLTRSLFKKCFGEAAIHGLILVPILGAENRTSMRDMAQRPQTFIGESKIESLLFLRSEPNAAKRVLRMIR